MRILNLLRLLALAAVFFSISCKKRAHFEVACKIEKITSKYRFYETDPFEVSTYTFTNNAWGDPVKITQSNTTTGRPNYSFTYDNNQRLKTFIADYGPGYIEYYTRYFYDNNNFIVRDTTLFAGTDINNPASFYQAFVNEYSYDSKGRVSKVINHLVGYPSTTQEKVYTYNSNDNLVRSGGTYDNKTNYLRTSLVLAFMMRDYSKNNFYPALTYNSKNLPTSYPADPRNEGAPAFFNTPITEIEYTCDNNDND
jgi:hypothetical protein